MAENPFQGDGPLLSYGNTSSSLNWSDMAAGVLSRGLDLGRSYLTDRSAKQAAEDASNRELQRAIVGSALADRSSSMSSGFGGISMGALFIMAGVILGGILIWKLVK